MLNFDRRSTSALETFDMPAEFHVGDLLKLYSVLFGLFLGLTFFYVSAGYLGAAVPLAAIVVPTPRVTIPQRGTLPPIKLSPVQNVDPGHAIFNAAQTIEDGHAGLHFKTPKVNRPGATAPTPSTASRPPLPKHWRPSNPAAVRTKVTPAPPAAEATADDSEIKAAKPELQPIVENLPTATE
jgi:hypothetical protein